MKHHDVKCDPDCFEGVIQEKKLYEVRVNDREYVFGDTIQLHEYDRTMKPPGISYGEISYPKEPIGYSGRKSKVFRVGWIVELDKTTIPGIGSKISTGRIVFSLLPLVLP